MKDERLFHYAILETGCLPMYHLARMAVQINDLRDTAARVTAKDQHTYALRAVFPAELEKEVRKICPNIIITSSEHKE